MKSENLNRSIKVGASGHASQYLSFSLGADYYGVDILRVHEIRGWEPVREIPGTPKYIKGVLNLRGAIVPVIDLRRLFGIEGQRYTSTTVVVVLSIEDKTKQTTVGVVVDAVSDVLDVSGTEIKSSPDFGVKVDTRFIQGIVMSEDRMVVLLDADKLLKPDELSVVEAAGGV